MRKIDAKVNMPGAMKANIDGVLTSTNDAVSKLNGLEVACWF
jgi:hypothetical protein